MENFVEMKIMLMDGRADVNQASSFCLFFFLHSMQKNFYKIYT